MTKLILSACAVLTAAVLSFSVPSAGTTDVPDLNCVQIERPDRTWVICTDDMLDDDEVDVILDRAERVRQHIFGPAGKEGGL
jgi:hypothetical protein